MTRQRRRAALLFLSLALCATALLAAGLPRLRLEPGMPRPELVHGTRFLLPVAGERAPASIPVSKVLFVPVCVILAATLVWMAYRFLRGVDWRALGKDLLRGLLLAAGLCGALLILMLVAPESRTDAGSAPTPPEVAEVRTPLGRPPAVVLWMTAALLALGASLALAGWLRPSRRYRDPLLEIGEEAGRAREMLLAGGSARGVIVACYQRMTRAVAEGQGIERAASMTAREFERVLGGLGLPEVPVQELTRLFEAARYGGRTATPDEEARAIACLSAIVEHCRRSRRPD